MTQLNVRNLEIVRCTAWRSRQKLHSTVFECQPVDRFIFILMKTKNPSLAMVTLCFHSSFKIVSHSTSAFIKFRSRLRGWLLENPMSSSRTLSHSTQEEQPYFGSQKISVATLPLTSYQLNLLIATPWIILCETNKTLWNAKDQLKAWIIETFKNLNKEIVRKSWSYLPNPSARGGYDTRLIFLSGV